MKKFISLFATVIAATLCIAALSACEVTKSTEDKYFTFEYVEQTDSYVVSASSLELPKTVFIPAEYEGKPVSAVKENGFSGENCYAVKDVVIRQEGNVTIGAYAFDGLKNLRSVDFSASCVTVGDYAFENCVSLSEINFKNPVEKFVVGSYAFKGCGIEQLAVTAQNVVVGEYAFANNPKLASLEFNGLSSFAASAVNGCTALAAIEVTGSYYSENGSVYTDVEGNKTLVRYAPAAPATELALNCGIGAYAFRNAVNLTKIDLSNVTYVAEYAFLGSSVVEFVGEFDSSAWAENWAVGSEYNA